ncbi:Methyl farnesoate epoxidase [Orchesella cincta]|uniref:Methyl farnesoate epoxidase n=1 Tax=Orchesella cincta TaxID=48709 RepID=A0A1D2M442_ORCCI|nr:Methyl farnesoate epoxidase [Orchesella cincta]
MIDFFTTFFIVCIALILWWIVEDRRSTANLPPGPPRLPIIGSLLSVTFKSELPAIALANLSKIYGDVVHVKMGMSSKVVFSTYEAAKEILDHDNANETDLVGIIGDRNMHQNMGEHQSHLILKINLDYICYCFAKNRNRWASEEVWRTLRRFTIRNLRDFGFGKAASMDVVINEELDAINEHRESETYATDPQTFIDVFLAKIEENQNHPIFNDEQLIYTLLDLFQAGADTSSNTLTFALLYLTLYPDIQNKVHEELDAAISKDTVITVEMKSKNIHGQPSRLNVDEQIWGDPLVFRPERFLTEDGEIDKGMAELVMAFGGGRRRCPAQNFGEATIFMYFTSVFRHFKLEKVVDGDWLLPQSQLWAWDTQQNRLKQRLPEKV